MSRRFSFPATKRSGWWPRKPRTSTFARLFASLLLVSTLGWAQSGCDVTNDGTVNAADLNSLLSMALGFSPCAAGIQGIGGCNVIAAQRVVNAGTGGKCSTVATGTSHSVTVNWIASVTTNVVGYNLYRAASPDGDYTMVNSALIGGTSYTDSSVLAGQTYYYAATAVDTSSNESLYSTSVSAIVPTP